MSGTLQEQLDAIAAAQGALSMSREKLEKQIANREAGWDKRRTVMPVTGIKSQDAAGTSSRAVGTAALPVGAGNALAKYDVPEGYEDTQPRQIREANEAAHAKAAALRERAAAEVADRTG